MKTKNLIEGLTILEKYNKNPDGYNVGAEHDQIYFYATELPVSQDDVKRLIELGWFQEDAETDGEEFSVEHYAPEENWSAFV